MEEEIMKHVIPELIILIPVLNAIGIFLKGSSVADWRIPWVLVALGVSLSFMWVFGTEGLSVLGCFVAIVQGVLVAAAAVLGHQLYVQTKYKE